MKTSIFVIQILPNGTVKQLCKLGNGIPNQDLNTALRTGRVTNFSQTDSPNGNITLTIIVEE